MTSIGGHLAHQMQTENCNSDLVQHSFIMNHHHHSEDIHPILTTYISKYQLLEVKKKFYNSKNTQISSF